jgi:hypothetical protein
MSRIKILNNAVVALGRASVIIETKQGLTVFKDEELSL